VYDRHYVQPVHLRAVRNLSIMGIASSVIIPPRSISGFMARFFSFAIGPFDEFFLFLLDVALISRTSSLPGR
jgi:hypothetical protein